MKILSSKRSYLNLLVAPAPIVGIVLFSLLKMNVPSLYITIIMVAIIVPSLVYWFTKGRRPAATIKDDVLSIRGGLFNDITIPKNSIEYMSYVAGEKIKLSRGEVPRDALRVKMDGYAEWDIAITDAVDHIDDRRLYRFINDNFYELSYEHHRG